MKTILSALALSVVLAGGAQANVDTSTNGGLPSWAVKAFTKVH